MDSSQEISSTFGKFHHIGIVVRDMDKAMEHFKAMGAGPFEPVTTPVSEKTFRGKPTEGYGIALKVAKLGDIMIELVQPLKGESPSMDFLNTKGEGINHICFEVDDLEKEAAMMSGKGYEAISSVKFTHGGGNMYFDTGRVGGVFTELLQQPFE